MLVVMQASARLLTKSFSSGGRKKNVGLISYGMPTYPDWLNWCFYSKRQKNAWSRHLETWAHSLINKSNQPSLWHTCARKAFQLCGPGRRFSGGRCMIYQNPASHAFNFLLNGVFGDFSPWAFAAKDCIHPLPSQDGAKQVYQNRWKFQDPKMEVPYLPYHIRPYKPYFGGISPEIYPLHRRPYIW